MAAHPVLKRSICRRPAYLFKLGVQARLKAGVNSVPGDPTGSPASLCSIPYALAP